MTASPFPLKGHHQDPGPPIHRANGRHPDREPATPKTLAGDAVNIGEVLLWGDGAGRAHRQRR